MSEQSVVFVKVFERKGGSATLSRAHYFLDCGTLGATQGTLKEFPSDQAKSVFGLEPCAACERRATRPSVEQLIEKVNQDRGVTHSPNTLATDIVNALETAGYKIRLVRAKAATENGTAPKRTGRKAAAAGPATESI